MAGVRLPTFSIRRYFTVQPNRIKSWEEAPAADNAAQQPAQEQEATQLILPSAAIPYVETAQHCFRELAKTKSFFTKGGVPVEAVTFKGVTKLVELEPTAFQSRLEEHFSLWKWMVLPNGEHAFKPSRCSLETAKVLLKTNAVQQFLPPIELITSSVLFVERSGRIEVLNKGYHDSLGGTLITKYHDITDVPLQQAASDLLKILDEFQFVHHADKSRAVAGFLAPALRLGAILPYDFPIDMSEADFSQSGKTYRQHINARLYDEEPEIVNKKNEHDGGVGGLDENISTALLSGKPFLMFENIRGKINSQILESALRGVGRVQVRKPYAQSQQVGTDRHIWLLSSNKAEVTRDLANRALVTRIQKQPPGFVYKGFLEGDLKKHVTKNADYFLSCVLSIVRYWHSKGKPKTNDDRHDFRESCQSLDWIVQNVFDLPPLLDGHRTEQDRISNPDLNWLRDVALKAKKDDRLDEKFRPSEIANLCEAHGIDIPGCRPGLPSDQVSMQTGKLLKRIFRDQREKLLAGISVQHSSAQEYNPQRQEYVAVNFYAFSLPEQVPNLSL
jgi:hypothetical protein